MAHLLWQATTLRGEEADAWVQDRLRSIPSFYSDPVHEDYDPDWNRLA